MYPITQNILGDISEYNGVTELLHTLVIYQLRKPKTRCQYIPHPPALLPRGKHTPLKSSSNSCSLNIEMYILNQTNDYFSYSEHTETLTQELYNPANKSARSYVYKTKSVYVKYRLRMENG